MSWRGTPVLSSLFFTLLTRRVAAPAWLRAASYHSCGAPQTPLPSAPLPSLILRSAPRPSPLLPAPLANFASNPKGNEGIHAFSCPGALPELSIFSSRAEMGSWVLAPLFPALNSGEQRGANLIPLLVVSQSTLDLRGGDVK